jgi:hypothetical protein
MWFDGMYLIKEWKLNLKTDSIANASEHWTKGYKRKQMQSSVIRWKWLADTPEMQFPCKVMLIRKSRRKLDAHDNLRMAFKKIVDTLSDLLIPGKAPGQADSSPLITWEYDQVSGSPQGIIVRFYSVDPEPPERNKEKLS